MEVTNFIKNHFSLEGYNTHTLLRDLFSEIFYCTQLQIQYKGLHLSCKKNKVENITSETPRTSPPKI